MQNLFVQSAHRHMHDLLSSDSPSSDIMSINQHLSFMNAINRKHQEMSPQALCLNHWPYMVLLSLLKHPYWCRHCQFGGRIPCHTLAFPLVLVSMAVLPIFVILITLLQVMTELSSYSLDLSGNVVYTEPQAPISQNKITLIHEYLSVLHPQSDHSQFSNITIQLLIISTALEI